LGLLVVSDLGPLALASFIVIKRAALKSFRAALVVRLMNAMTRAAVTRQSSGTVRTRQ